MERFSIFLGGFDGAWIVERGMLWQGPGWNGSLPTPGNRMHE
jgi:hypothetical protein